MGAGFCFQNLLPSLKMFWCMRLSRAVMMAALVGHPAQRGKADRKGWSVLSTCLVFMCVHMETAFLHEKKDILEGLKLMALSSSSRCCVELLI